MPANWPTKEELELIRESIFIRFLLEIVNKNIEETERTTMSLKPLYIASADRLNRLILNRQSEVRKLLNKSRIRVVDEDHGGDILYFRYFCRGYEERFGIMREVILAEMRVMMTEYMKNVFE